jgi:hypothetical protein
MRKMKKVILMVLSLATVLLMLSMPTLAGPPAGAAGLWQYQPFVKVYDADGECVPPTGAPGEVPCIETHGGNTVMYTFENGKWEGTFNGISTEDGKVVVYSSGALSFDAIVSFEGEVDDKFGALQMSVNGRWTDGGTEWQGRWVIISGTGELSTLHGQGTWWGPGAPDFGVWGDIYYAGNVHFEP